MSPVIDMFLWKNVIVSDLKMQLTFLITTKFQHINVNPLILTSQKQLSLLDVRSQIAPGLPGIDPNSIHYRFVL